MSTSRWRGRRLRVLPGEFGICRLPSGEELPTWAVGPDLVAAIRTVDELTVVCDAKRVPLDAEADGPWKALEVVGPLPLSEIGVLSSMAGPLAEAKLSVFVLSSFDTDHLLVRVSDLERAVVALVLAGHEVDRGSGGAVEE